MSQIDKVGGVSPENIPPKTAKAKPVTSEEVSFDKLLQESHEIAYLPTQTVKESNPLSVISLNLLPMQKSQRTIIGYQRIFLGTFSKKTQADILRTDEKINITSPLGNMKIERAENDLKLVYVEMPQGNFNGIIQLKENGDIVIESENKKKAIYIHPETNGDLTVTNKGVDESIRLVFKSAATS